jgi:hypothetical protein
MPKHLHLQQLMPRQTFIHCVLRGYSGSCMHGLVAPTCEYRCMSSGYHVHVRCCGDMMHMRKRCKHDRTTTCTETTLRHEQVVRHDVRPTRLDALQPTLAGEVVPEKARPHARNCDSKRTMCSAKLCVDACLHGAHKITRKLSRDTRRAKSLDACKTDLTTAPPQTCAPQNYAKTFRAQNCSKNVRRAKLLKKTFSAQNAPKNKNCKTYQKTNSPQKRLKNPEHSF